MRCPPPPPHPEGWGLVGNEDRQPLPPYPPPLTLSQPNPSRVIERAGRASGLRSRWATPQRCMYASASIKFRVSTAATCSAEGEGGVERGKERSGEPRMKDEE